MLKFIFSTIVTLVKAASFGIVTITAFSLGYTVGKDEV